jgi:hypothetical protein
MTNGQLTAVTVLLLAAHLAALAIAVLRKGWGGPMRLLNVGVGLAVLAYLAAHPKAFGIPIDGQVVALAVFEVCVVLVSALAKRGARLALAGAWTAFVVHFAASLGAAAFALLFKIDRLI